MLLRLLIVDDDTSLCGNLRSFFARHKYEVDVANDGLSAVKRAEEFHPNLMFLDIGLPGISGIEVLRQVKEKDPSIRVIMITGQTEDELMRQARVLGADDYVTKPFTLDYLSGEVLDKLHKQLFHEVRLLSGDLAVEREKVELLFDQVQEGVMMFDTQGLVFIANPVARRILGLGDNLNGMKAQKVFSRFKSPGGPNPLENLNGQKDVRLPFDLIREEPKKLIVECRINPILNHKKEIIGYLLLFRDVTQERRADTAMHRFISVISHKLRTPLVSIRGYPPLLLSPNAERPLDAFQRSAVETILKECVRLEDYVNELIAFSSVDPDELVRQTLSIQDLVKEAQKILPAELQNQKDKMKLDPELAKLKVTADPTLMQHAFRNIMENAFKFGAQTLQIKAQREGDAVTVQFIDDGPGIPPEDRERVFERFYQVDKDFVGQIPGAGLGLTMVKETVQAHGGQVRVECPNGKGSIFYVKLPAAKT